MSYCIAEDRLIRKYHKHVASWAKRWRFARSELAGLALSLRSPSARLISVRINQWQQLGYNELQTCSGTDSQTYPYPIQVHHENSLSAESSHQYQVTHSAMANSVLVGSSAVQPTTSE